MSDKSHEQVGFLEPFVIAGAQLLSRWGRNGRLQMLKIRELLLLLTAGIHLPSRAKSRVGWCSSQGCHCLAPSAGRGFQTLQPTQ